MVMLSDFSKDINNDERNNKEINEAIRAGERALESLYAAKKKLSSAEGFGFFDIMGGGMFTSMIKHSNMRDAQSYLEFAKRDLQIFSRELQDVDDSLQIYIGDFLSFADIFLDGLFFDVLVQSKISKAKRNVEEAIYKVERILDELR